MEVPVEALVELVLRINAADESEINSDFAVPLLEEMRYVLSHMNKNEKDSFKASIGQLTAKARGERKKFISEFVANANLED